MKYFVVLFLLISVFIYGAANFQSYGNVFGKRSFQKVELTQLLSYGNVYSGKDICTQGIYIESDKLTIIKVDLEEDQFTKSAWIDNPTGKSLIFDASKKANKAIDAEICGSFLSGRGGEYGEPSVWNHQITVKTFTPLGKTIKSPF